MVRTHSVLPAVVSRHRVLLIVIVLLVVAAIALRVALPGLVKRYVNQQLQAMENYTGHVQEIDIALWRGAYDIEKVVIEKRAAKRNEPFFAAQRLQLSMQWRALWKGSLVGRARFDNAELNLVQSEDKSERQLGTENNWNETLSNLFPFTFNEITVHDSVVRFRAPGIKRKEALELQQVHFVLRNLTNVFKADQAAYASFDLKAQALGHGALKVDGKLDPHAKNPQFEVATQLDNVELRELNPWLETYAGVNAKDGTFSLYSEFAAAEGRFKGYVKPIAKDLDVTAPKEDKDNLFRKAWAGLVELAAKIFQNQPKDQLATKVPFSGSVDDPDADVLVTIFNILRNAFVSAFSNSLDHSVSLRDVAKEGSSDGIKMDEKNNEGDKDKNKDKKENSDEKDKSDRGPASAFDLHTRDSL